MLAAKVPGYLASVPVVNGQALHKGDVVARLDDGDYRLAAQAAHDKLATQEAAIARIGRQVEAAQAQMLQASAQIDAAKADAVRASADYARQQQLEKVDFVARARIEQARADRDRTEAAVKGAEASLVAMRANVEVLRAQGREAEGVAAELRTAEARAARDWEFTTIRAPFDGVVGNKAVEAGAYVQPGSRIAALVPLESVRVDANFKETQVGRMHPGQRVHIAVDAYPDRDIVGEVESLSPASGSVFSLLPPDNATGNFTKIVPAPARARARPHRGRPRGHPAPRPVGDRAGRHPRGIGRVRPHRRPARVSAMAASAVPAATPAEPPLDRRRMVAFVCMVFGMFMAILDIQIVSASLAEIQAGLSASGDEIPWVQTSYLIAEVISIPLSGFLSRVLSTRWMFVISAGGFTLMSLACATSTSINEMIVWRAAQGFIGGGMIPTVFASAFTIFPPSKRSIVSPMIGLVATLAPTIGPTVGGYLTDLFDWHWLFLVNVVPGILVTVSTYLLIDFDEPNLGLFKRFDWFGLVFMALMLGCLEYVLEEGPNHDWLQPTRRYFACVIVCVVGGLGLLLARASRRPSPSWTYVPSPTAISRRAAFSASSSASASTASPISTQSISDACAATPPCRSARRCSSPVCACSPPRPSRAGFRARSIRVILMGIGFTRLRRRHLDRHRA